VIRQFLWVNAKKMLKNYENRIFIQVWPPEATMGIAFRSTLKQNINTNRKNGEIKYFLCARLLASRLRSLQNNVSGLIDVLWKT